LAALLAAAPRTLKALAAHGFDEHGELELAARADLDSVGVVDGDFERDVGH
jgi:hypothetical protein